MRTKPGALLTIRRGVAKRCRHCGRGIVLAHGTKGVNTWAHSPDLDEVCRIDPVTLKDVRGTTRAEPVDG